MSNTAPTWLMSFVPVILLTWFAFGWLLRNQRFCPRWQCQGALVLISMGVAALPVGGLPAGSWFAAIVPGLSLPTLSLLLDGIHRHAGGNGWLPSTQRTAVFIFAVVAGVALYPSAMGWGRFDVYTPGWNFSALTVAVGALGVLLIWRGRRFSLVLGAALLAWQLRLLESRNLWDYLVDPILFLLSAAVLIGKLVRRKMFPDRFNHPS